MRIGRLICCLGLLLSVSTIAWAQEIEQRESYQSSKSFYLEIKFGPYSPNIDQEFGTTHPFQDIFGSGTDLLMSGEFDWELWQKFGSFSLGGSIGRYNTTAQAFVDQSTNGQATSTTERSGTQTSLTLVPLGLLAIYRFDVLANRFNFPVIPFAKFGINYTLWWSDKGDSTAVFKDQQEKEFKGNGGTFGWQFNAGVALRLDQFDPQSAKNLDVDLGINHTDVFFEYTYIKADGFGSNTALNVGDSTWNAGIAFEF